MLVAGGYVSSEPLIRLAVALAIIAVTTVAARSAAPAGAARVQTVVVWTTLAAAVALVALTCRRRLLRDHPDLLRRRRDRPGRARRLLGLRRVREHDLRRGRAPQPAARLPDRRQCRSRWLLRAGDGADREHRRDHPARVWSTSSPASPSSPTTRRAASSSRSSPSPWSRPARAAGSGASPACSTPPRATAGCRVLRRALAARRAAPGDPLAHDPGRLRDLHRCRLAGVGAPVRHVRQRRVRVFVRAGGGVVHCGPASSRSRRAVAEPVPGSIYTRSAASGWKRGSRREDQPGDAHLRRLGQVAGAAGADAAAVDDGHAREVVDVRLVRVADEEDERLDGRLVPEDLAAPARTARARGPSRRRPSRSAAAARP